MSERYPYLTWTDLADRLEAAEAENARLREAAMALYERVQMDESVGICLSERATALALGDVLAPSACSAPGMCPQAGCSLCDPQGALAPSATGGDS